jgi:hypothetical protein
MNYDSLGSILRLSHGDKVTALQPAWLDGLQQTGALDDDAVHAGPDRRKPFAPDPDVGRKVGRRKEPFGEHSVGRKRRKIGLRRASERRLAEIG